MLYFYLYSVTGVSLFVFTISVISGVNGFFDFLFQVPLEPYETVPAYQSALAAGLGYALISLPIWLYHWRRLTRESQRFVDNLLTAHRFYLFTVVCLSVMLGIIAGGNGLSGLLQLAFGFTAQQAITVSNVAASFAILIVAAALWLHHWRQFRGRFGDFEAMLKPATSS